MYLAECPHRTVVIFYIQDHSMSDLDAKSMFVHGYLLKYINV